MFEKIPKSDEEQLPKINLKFAFFNSCPSDRPFVGFVSKRNVQVCNSIWLKGIDEFVTLEFNHKKSVVLHVPSPKKFLN